MKASRRLFPKTPDSSKSSDGRTIPLWVFWLCVSFLYYAVFTFIDFADNPFTGLRGLVTLMAQSVVIGFAASGVIGVLCCNRCLFAVGFPVLTVASVILGYFHLTLGISLSAANVELMAVNGFGVWTTLISPQLVAWSLLGLMVSVMVATVRWRCVRQCRWYLLGVASVLIILLTNVFVQRWADPVSFRMPYCFYYTFRDYLKNKKVSSQERHTFDLTTVRTDSVRPTVVVVIGESLRPDHLGFNGYVRPTTPRLATEANLVSYRNVYSDYSGTHLCLPQMLTRADSLNPDLGYTESSFIPLLRKAGYRSLWVSNQDKNPYYSYFMSEADSLVMVNPGWTTHNFMPVHDRDMLPHIARFLKGNHADNPKLLIAHTMGSHWVYNLSYPSDFARYKPEVDSRIISELSVQQLVNSYDNTILATDDFLGRLIDMLRDDNAVIIYMSDHGENLGEDGKYLHGAPTEQSLHPACFLWYSDKYGATFPSKVANLRRNSGRRWRTDILFHTVIDAAGLTTEVMDTSLSVMRGH